MASLSAAKPSVTPDNKPAGWLVAALSSAGLIFAAVGIPTQDLPHAFNNHPVQIATTLVLLLLGAALGAFAGWFTKDGTLETWCLRWSGILLLCAALAGVWTGVAAARESPEPSLTGEIVTDKGGNSTLHFGVKATGVRANKQMTVVISALAPDPAAPKGPEAAIPLYSASLGPGASGAVDRSGVIALPPAPVDNVELQAWTGQRPQSCISDESSPDSQPATTAGCTELQILRPVERPQLLATWVDAKHSSAGLKISLSASDIGAQFARLRVNDIRTNPKRDHTLLGTTWAPDGNGDVLRSLTAVVPASRRRLCVSATTDGSTPKCRGSKRNQAWEVVSAPPK